MRNRILRQITTAVLTATWLLSPACHAAERVTLIDPGHIANPKPGFRVVISAPGTYRLTGNLTVPTANTTGIEVNADHVTIDLNGFAIQGPAHCSAAPVSCSPIGTGNGVHAVNRQHIVVMNGRIQGMGNLGVYLETKSARLQRLRLIGNGGGGAAFFGGRISDSTVEANGGAGIFGLNIAVRGNLIRNNRLFGLQAYGQSTYTGNRFSANNGGGPQVNGKPRQTGGNRCNASHCP